MLLAEYPLREASSARRDHPDFVFDPKNSRQPKENGLRVYRLVYFHKFERGKAGNGKRQTALGRPPKNIHGVFAVCR